MSDAKGPRLQRVRVARRASSVDSVLVVGLGLMGGSLGLAIKTFLPGITVGGHDAGVDVARRAQALGAIDRVEPDGFPGLCAYQIVFVATPVGTIASILAAIAARASPGTILTDLGSAKGSIHRDLAGAVPPTVRYIGGHPMTGSEIEGLDGADPHLYENALWLLTDPNGPSGEQRDRLRGVLEGIGALVVEIDPTVHDRIVSMTSHLPYLAAVALVNALLDRFPAPKKALELAAGGFLDTTRVAACPPGVFCDILLANREEVLVGLSLLRSRLAKLEADLASGNAEALETTLARARELRRTLPRFRRGFPVSHHELVVRAQDRPGFLGQLASSLGDARINIVDFVLMHVREGEPGTILLAFRTEDDLDCAVRTLEATGFSVHRR